MLKGSDRQAMVLAAGLGTRLKPFSLVRPKPLFPVLDQPLLARTLWQLNEASFARITVNAHHLREQFVSFFAGKEDIRLQLEDTILGTGGGLRLASDDFGSDPVLVTNGDIFHSINLAWVYDQHMRSRAQITMVLHDFPRFNNVLVSQTDHVLAFGSQIDRLPDDYRLLAFTGIHVIAPEILRAMPPGVFYDVIDCYREFLTQGGTINGLVVNGHFWTDMGTTADYLALHGKLLHEAAASGGSPFFFGTDSLCGRNLKLHDWACIGTNATVDDNVSLERVVVWDGAQVPAGSKLRDTIVC